MGRTAKKGTALLLAVSLIFLCFSCVGDGRLSSPGDSFQSEGSSEGPVSHEPSSSGPESPGESSSSEPEDSSFPSSSSQGPSGGGSGSLKPPSSSSKIPASSTRPVSSSKASSKPVPSSSKASSGSSGGGSGGMPAVTARMPSASGKVVYQGGGAVIDASNVSSGYIMVKHSGSSARIKFLLYQGGSSGYVQFNITSNGAWVTLPITKSGGCRIRVMEQTASGKYAELFSASVQVSLKNGTTAYLYPNQSVNYTRSSAAVKKSQSLCAGAASVQDKVNRVYKFITSTVKYDYDKAQSASTTYLPKVDSILSSKKGICYDYAALMACMLRSQDVPTKLVIGTAGGGRHAWNEVYVNGAWKRYDPTFGAAGQTGSGYTAEEYR